MLIYAIDDEHSALDALRDAIRCAAPDAEVVVFQSPPRLLGAMDAREPDVVFAEIRLPKMDGLALAGELRRKAPGTKLVFVTDCAQYALEAYRLHVHGYVLKPVNAELIRAELDNLFPPPPEPEEKLWVQCFGHFEVFWRGEPVIFQRKQSKELLAFLIDREGRACTAEEIAAALWEDEGDLAASKARIRRILSDLRATLREIGMEDALIRRRRQLAIRRDRVDCDYYRLLSGDTRAVNKYRGEYMTEYSWAELTNARLHFRGK